MEFLETVIMVTAGILIAKAIEYKIIKEKNKKK